MIILILGLAALPLFILGLFLRKGKGLMLLAGYNTMPKEDRKKVDKAELSRVSSNLILRMALATLLLGVTIHLGMTWATIILVVVMIADPIIGAVRMSRSMPRARMSKKGGVIALAITAVALIGVGIMFYYGEKEPVFNVLDNGIQIQGMYGGDISFSNVTKISLVEKSMKEIGTGRRDNGYGGFGTTLKGHFSSPDLGKYMLFVRSESAPTIWIERQGREDIYISFGDGEKTTSLYQELKAAVP